jgi:glycosyltransferase involved in cell wall biosynthesis
MHILILTHYYPPEIGAPQARLSEMAAAWTDIGHKVTVLTCFPNHPTGTIPPNYLKAYKKRRLTETINGVTVERCWVYATPNKGFAKKLLGHISFMVSSVLQKGNLAARCDIILVSSPTFFSVISAWWLGLIYKKPYVFEVRDLWPAIFVELGVLKNRVIINLLERVELFLYRKAALVVPVTSRFRDNIISRGIDAKKVHVITNGVDLSRFSPKPPCLDIIEKHNLSKRFIVMYIGAHGISHSLTKIIDAAKLCEKEKDILFLFVGEGAEKDKIVEYSKKLNSANVMILPGQPKEKMADFYSIMDIGLVPLRNIPLFDTFIPSKMFEIMAMAKPIVASVRGEAAEILNKSGGAIVVEPESVDKIAEAVLKLHNNSESRKKLGDSGREYAISNFDRKLLAGNYAALLGEKA